MGAGDWFERLRRVFRPFLTAAERRRVSAAIAAAERLTTGEIHVHLCGRLRGREPLIAARETFAALGLDKTKARNGVIILVADLEHRFAVWGDRGVHEAAGQTLWDEASKLLADHLRQGRAADGLVACVEAVGRELARLFPRAPGDVNELSDEVSG